MEIVLWVVCTDRPIAARPANSMIPTKTVRNREIVWRHFADEGAADIALEFGTSVSRVYQLMRSYRESGQHQTSMYWQPTFEAHICP